jgi:ubiquinone/menaquinone biosynthesis C-methylase UbiE
METLLAELRAIAEPTRLRIVVALSQGELTVSELVQLLGQSQPRISRHLKTLVEAGIVERLPEGSWAYYRLIELRQIPVTQAALTSLPQDDLVLKRDTLRRAEVIADRSAAAERYFTSVANDWDQIRALHIDEARIVDAMRALAGEGPFDLHIDLGTGTGAVLEAFADRARRGIGVDRSHDMLTVARSKLGEKTSRLSLQHSDVASLPFADGIADLVTVHHVLHYLSDPRSAVQEAARILRPGGLLLIVDFAPHDHEFMRQDHAHTRLGFAPDEVGGWLQQAGLTSWDLHRLEAEKPDGLSVCLWFARAVAQTGLRAVSEI